MWWTAFINFRTSFIKIFYSFFTFQQTRLYNIIAWQLLSTWLWRWLPHRLSKRQSPTTVLFRTTLTRTITLYELLFLVIWAKTVRRLVVPSLPTVKVLWHDSVRELLPLFWLVRRFFCPFVLFFSFFRFSGVVRNYQAKLIRVFLPLGVVQKQMKSPMNDLSFVWTIT